MNPLLLEFPAEFETERLVIRMPKPGDGKAVFHAINASIEQLKPWMPFAHREQSEVDVEINIREAHTNFLKHEDLRFLVFHKVTGEFIASTGLHRIEWSVPKFEIGYWVDSRFSGSGYITETVKGLANFAFEELKARRIEIRCDSKNDKSRAVAARVGFTLDCILINNDVAADGKELRDTCIYSMVK